jgi:hypothetical protein
MKKIFAIASLALLTSTAWAHHETFSGNPDMYNSPLLDHATNESQSMQRTAVQPGIGDGVSQFGDTASHKLDLDHDGWTDLNNSEIYGSF